MPPNNIVNRIHRHDSWEKNKQFGKPVLTPAWNCVMFETLLSTVHNNQFYEPQFIVLA